MTDVTHHSHTSGCHSVMSHITVTHQDVTVLCHIMKSHDECGRVVHRPYSSCISSVQNPMDVVT